MKMLEDIILEGIMCKASPTLFAHDINIKEIMCKASPTLFAHDYVKTSPTLFAGPDSVLPGMIWIVQKFELSQ